MSVGRGRAWCQTGTGPPEGGDDCHAARSHVNRRVRRKEDLTTKTRRSTKDTKKENKRAVARASACFALSEVGRLLRALRVFRDLRGKAASTVILLGIYQMCSAAVPVNEPLRSQPRARPRTRSTRPIES